MNMYVITKDIKMIKKEQQLLGLSDYLKHSKFEPPTRNIRFYSQ